MSGRWDCVVVGAGPAGARAAELLSRRGASVLMLDPKAPWEKPCGGGLTAAALRHTPELRELADEGVTIDELLVVVPSGASIVIPVRSPYLVVSRLTLSRWGLARALRAGARFVSTMARTTERDAGGWRVTDSNGTVHRARWLVAADGAASRLRGRLAPRLRPELAPTRVAYPTRGSQQGRAVFSLLPRGRGYVWDFPRPDHHSVGIGIEPGTFTRPSLDEAIAQYQVAEVGEDGSLDQRGAVVATSNWESGRFEDLGSRGFALLGDTAGLADPVTGEGIDYAFRSAALAAATFNEANGFASYSAAARREFAQEFTRARRIRRWLYRTDFADRLVRRARRSPRAALLLMSLSDALNEHGSIGAALYRSLLSAAPDHEAALAVCDCPDGPETVRSLARSA